MSEIVDRCWFCRQRYAHSPHDHERIFTTASALVAFVYACLAGELNTARIDELTGLKGKMNEKEGVYKITFPRDDVKIVVNGWIMPPFMGLGTWAAFTQTKGGAMVMGDTVRFVIIRHQTNADGIIVITH
jgi:Domain of Unknown Function (DUF1259)